MKFYQFMTIPILISHAFLGDSVEQKLLGLKRNDNAIYIKELEEDEMFWRTLGYASIPPSKYHI